MKRHWQDDGFNVSVFYWGNGKWSMNVWHDLLGMFIRSESRLEIKDVLNRCKKRGIILKRIV